RKIMPNAEITDTPAFVAAELVPVGPYQIEIRRATPTASPPGIPQDTPQNTIVCLHEGLGSVSQWRDWPERLATATDRAVVAYSRPGYGASTPLTPFGPDFLEREAREVLPA